MPSFRKDPSAVLDYKFDWKALTNGTGIKDWLAIGETIVSYTITATTGITVDSSYLTDANTSVTVWLSGGTEPMDYSVTCHIVTSAGPREDDRSITIRCRSG